MCKSYKNKCNYLPARMNKNFKYFSSNSKKRNRNKTALFSIEDIESSKAQLISQVVGSQNNSVFKGFDSNLYRTGLNTDVPTSYHPRNTDHGRQQPRSTIPTYRTLNKGQGLRWNPYVEINSEEENVQDDNVKYNCRCDDCTTFNCPSKMPSSTFRPSYQFKDNIVKFSDQSTMTRRLNDACCDVQTPTNISASAIPNNLGSEGVENNNSERPLPILKNVENGQQPCADCGHNHCARLNEAVRDTDLDEECPKPVKSRSIKSFFSKKKVNPECKQCDSSRKILYNEGISDVVTNLPYPLTPFRVPRNVDCSRTSLVGKLDHYPENMIPHAHGCESRYHQYCKKMFNGPIHYADSESQFVKHAVVNPKMIRTTFKSDFKSAHGKPPSICLPKKVLTSERNIESFIEKRYPVSPIPPFQKHNMLN